MDLGIAGRKAAVAAATAGLGRAVAAALVAEGVEVTICGSDEGRARAAAEELGAGWLVADLSDPVAAGRFVDEARAAMGGLDILVVNGPGPAAGIVTEVAADAYQGGAGPGTARTGADVPGRRAGHAGAALGPHRRHHVAGRAAAVHEPGAVQHRAHAGPPGSCARWPVRSPPTASPSTRSSPGCTPPRGSRPSTATTCRPTRSRPGGWATRTTSAPSSRSCARRRRPTSPVPPSPVDGGAYQALL